MNVCLYGWIYVFYAAIIRWDATDVRRINAADNQNLRISWDWKSDREKTDVYARTTWVDRWKPYHKPKYQTNYIAVALYVNVMFAQNTSYIINSVVVKLLGRFLLPAKKSLYYLMFKEQTESD